MIVKTSRCDNADLPATGCVAPLGLSCYRRGRQPRPLYAKISAMFRWLQRFGAFARRPRKVVYTCLFGDYERFNDFEYEPSSDIDFVLFTDDAEIVSQHWKTIVMPRGMLDAGRAVREIKTQPHRFLADYDWSLFIDNTVRLKVSPQEIFEK